MSGPCPFPFILHITVCPQHRNPDRASQRLNDTPHSPTPNTRHDDNAVTHCRVTIDRDQRRDPGGVGDGHADYHLRHGRRTGDGVASSRSAAMNAVARSTPRRLSHRTCPEHGPTAWAIHRGATVNVIAGPGRRSRVDAPLRDRDLAQPLPVPRDSPLSIPNAIPAAKGLTLTGSLAGPDRTGPANPDRPRRPVTSPSRRTRWPGLAPRPAPGAACRSTGMQCGAVGVPRSVLVVWKAPAYGHTPRSPDPRNTTVSPEPLWDRGSAQHRRLTVRMCVCPHRSVLTLRLTDFGS